MCHASSLPFGCSGADHTQMLFDGNDENATISIFEMCPCSSVGRRLVVVPFHSKPHLVDFKQEYARLLANIYSSPKN